MAFYNHDARHLPDVGNSIVADLPPYLKMLVELGSAKYPFLGLAGGLNGAKIATSWEFDMSQTFDPGAGADVSISEDASLTAPAATSIARALNKNVAQIFQRKVSVTYARESDTAGLTNLSVDGESASPEAFQIQGALAKMSRDFGWAGLNGTKVVSTDSTVAYKTGGIIASATTQVDTASDSVVVKADVDNLLATMFENGAEFSESMTIFCNARNKIILTNLYGIAERNFFVGGVAVDRLITDFGVFNIVIDQSIDANTIVAADMKYVAPVILPFKSNDILVEELAKTGAASDYQIYAQMGWSFTAPELHGVLTITQP